MPLVAQQASQVHSLVVDLLRTSAYEKCGQGGKEKTSVIGRRKLVVKVPTRSRQSTRFFKQALGIKFVGNFTRGQLPIGFLTQTLMQRTSLTSSSESSFLSFSPFCFATLPSARSDSFFSGSLAGALIVAASVSLTIEVVLLQASCKGYWNK